MNNTALNAASQAQPSLPLAPLHLPAEPGFWPLAWGWWACLALALLIFIVAIVLIKRRKKRHLAKKTALRLLVQNAARQKGKKKVATANDLLRQVCLSYYPRPMLASLHGERWYAFLDEQHPSKKANFQSNQLQWQTALYQKQPVADEVADALYLQVETWITQALPPSKKQIKAAQAQFKSNTMDLNDGVVSKARPAKSAPKGLIEKERVLNQLEEKVKGSQDDV
ncbi:DUF4381 domain-containing protein [Vibrio gangliei]|uniref:DUF4381 domain-containing protein n=1 Tax=Vibrio gangliei TaxID=2077090 RepID=UPI000D01D662|nr:DUF4381 domain-containing protein [Vibrio gangliei]